MSDRDVEVVFAADASVGEGPVWLDGRLLWVDLPEGILHLTDLADRRDSVRDFGGVLGAVVPRVDGGYAAAMQDGFATIDDDGLTVVDAVVPEAHLRMNDGKCDAAGRFWAGSCPFNEADPVGALYVWQSDIGARVVDSGFILPNGLGWSPDNARLYLVDSMTYCLYAYDFDLPSGQVTNRRELRRFDVADGIPDGLAVDSDDTIWLAFFGGGAVQRLDSSGATIEAVTMPVSRPTSCAFGDGSDLYITTARKGLSPDDLAGQPLAGSVLRIDAGVSGVPVSAAR